MSNYNDPTSTKGFHLALAIFAIYNCVFSQIFAMQLLSGQVESFIPVVILVLLYYSGGFRMASSLSVWHLPLLVLGYNLFFYFGFGLLRDVIVWLIGIYLIQTAYDVRHWNFVFKLLLFAGVLYVLSLIFEFLFPDLYFSYYYPLFKGDFSDRMNRLWSGTRHTASGLSHQIGFTVSYIVVGMGLLVFIFLEKMKKRQKLLYLLLFLIGLVLAQKRLHFAATIFSIVCVYMLSSPSGKKTKIVLWMTLISIAFLTIAITLADYLGATSVFDRYTESFNLHESGESISASRDVLRMQALNLWYENPILGIGWNRFRSMDFDFTTVHNVFLQLLCETGIVGAVLILLPIFRSFIKTISMLKSFDKRLKLPALQFSAFYQIFFIIYFFTGNPLYDYPYLIPYFISVAIAHYYNKNRHLLYQS